MTLSKLFLGIIVFTLSSNVTALGKTSGRETGNGGNDSAIEFSDLTLEAIAEMESDAELTNLVKSVNLKKTLQETTVLMVEDSLTVNIGKHTQEVTAINYNDPNTILVNESRWLKMKRKIAKKTLALHEMLGLVGLESTGDYRISALYQRKFRVPPVSTDKLPQDTR